MDNEQILKTFQSADTEYIYGEMYGLHEGVRVKRRFLKIEKEKLRLSVQKDCLLFGYKLLRIQRLRGHVGIPQGRYPGYEL